MKVKYHKDFQKSYKKRIAPYPKLVKQFEAQVTKFLHDSSEPSVRDHKLVGKKKNFRAFSITGDIRVIYIINKDELWLLDVGTHNQVY